MTYVSINELGLYIKKTMFRGSILFFANEFQNQHDTPDTNT